MKKRVHRKIHHIRQQPESTRVRAALVTALVGGVGFVLLWLLVFLPLQLRLRPGGDSGGNELAEATSLPGAAAVPQVGGTSQDGMISQSASPSPLTTPTLP